MFSAAAAAAFINGLSRFALLFLFVFYFQGVEGDDPIVAGIKITPMAIGMLIASPLAGIYADRHGSRGLAALGMVVSGVALALMTTLSVSTPYWETSLWLLLVGIGSGMFNSPNTAAMMGTVPQHRRGIAAGARMMLQNTGAVISIAFVLAIVTAAVPKDVLFQIFSGLASGLSQAKLDPFIHNMHTALWVLAATSFVGAGVSLLRPRHSPGEESGRALRGRRRDRAGVGMSARDGRDETLRIGDVARLTGHDSADDPLLRGDRAAAGGRGQGARRPPHLPGGGRRAPPGGAAAQGPARSPARGAERSSWPPRRPVRRCGANGAAGWRIRSGSAQILEESLVLHRPPAGARAPPPRRDREARGGPGRPQAARARPPPQPERP